MGVKGVVIVGFIAALMTSLAAHFNSSATLFTMDFYKHWKPKASEKKLVKIGRIATVCVVVLGLIWIPIMSKLGNVLYEYLQEVQSLIAPAIAAVFIMGVFNRKITPKAGEWGLLTGFCIGMIRLILMIVKPASLAWFTNINWLVFCLGLFFFTILLMFVISMFTEKPKEENIKGLTYFSQTPQQKKETRDSWTWVDVATSLGVVALCVTFYVIFW
jgi:SSS family solute:Na+ symporter